MEIEESARAAEAHAPKMQDLGRYRLIAELARGGMGVVYLALLNGAGGFHKLFVIKELKRHLAEEPSAVRMFVEEARIAAKLNHPNVVQTHEIGAEGDRPFIAMEYLEGQSLHRLLRRAQKRGDSPPLATQLFMLTRMLEGLHYAHSLVDCDGAPLGLVHRDVSPHNVFVTYDGQVKLLDFGIAKSLDSSHETRVGVVKGKVAYMAPEQASGKAVDRRGDLFAAGVMLWEAVAGERMWEAAENDLQILRRLMNGDVPEPRGRGGLLAPELARIVRKATAANRDDRYATAEEMQVDLEAHLGAMDGPASGAREVGRLLAAFFSEERAQLKAVIDGQLRALRRATSGEFARLDMAELQPFAQPRGTASGVRSAGTPLPPAPDPAAMPRSPEAPARARARARGPKIGLAATATLAVVGLAVALARGPGAAAERGDRRPPAAAAASASVLATAPHAEGSPSVPLASPPATASAPVPALPMPPRAAPRRGPTSPRTERRVADALAAEAPPLSPAATPSAAPTTKPTRVIHEIDTHDPYAEAP